MMRPSCQPVILYLLFSPFVDAHLRNEERRLTHTTVDFAEFKLGDTPTQLGHGIQLQTLTRRLNRHGEEMVPASAVVTATNPPSDSQGNALVISAQDGKSEVKARNKTGGRFVMDFEEQLVLKSISLVNSKGGTEFDVLLANGQRRHMVTGEGSGVGGRSETIKFGKFGLFDVLQFNVTTTSGGNAAISSIDLAYLAEL